MLAVSNSKSIRGLATQNKFAQRIMRFNKRYEAKFGHKYCLLAMTYTSGGWYALFAGRDPYFVGKSSAQANEYITNLNILHGLKNYRNRLVVK